VFKPIDLPVRPGAKLLQVMLAGLALLPLANLAQDDQGDTAAVEPLQWETGGELTMRIENNMRITELKQDVRLTRGSLLILGDSALLEFNLDRGDFDRVSVFGSSDTPVRYSQALEDGEGEVAGSGESLVLFTDPATGETVIELTGNASIRSPDSAMNCAAITYISERDLIREAQGPCIGTLTQTSN